MNAVKVNTSRGTFDLKPLKLKCHVDSYALHEYMCAFVKLHAFVTCMFYAVYIFTCCIETTLIKLLAFGHFDLLQWHI